MDHHFAEPKAYAAEWDSPERDAWQKPAEIVAALGLQSGETVAELGSGTGYLIESLRSAVGSTGKVVALDMQPAMIAYLQARAAKSQWTNVQARQTAADNPGLAPASVDAVVTLNTWHHVAERTAYARQVLAALKPGGRFVIVDFLAEPTEGHGPPLAMRLPAEKVIAELTAAGFAAKVADETMPRHYLTVATKP